jgi:ubiquinone/menaquinone biosynthesis C-methylase UbiE
MNTESRRGFLPAAGHDWLLPLYDPFVRLFGGDRAREALLEQAALRPGHRVLDIGCGTGTFAVRVKRQHPGVEVVGLDPDPKALARAKAKAARESLEIGFDLSFADALPYPDASFDRVFSSFMFHHLPADEKASTLREVRRVLKAAGSFHMLDFGGPEHAHGFLSHFIHSHDQLKGNAEASVLELMRRAGFEDAKTVGDRRTWFGRVKVYRADSASARA